MDLRNFEEKWQKEWAAKGIYEPADSGGKKRFYTAAFPYPNSPQHIGHGRTYTILDIHARYARLCGNNVLLPMAFHVTGTPIIAMAKKVREKDAELLSIFKNIYAIPESKFEELGDPRELVLYFSREIEEGMKEMGYSIDWRRKFYTFDAHFNKFIQWQMRKLKEQGLIIQGSHFLSYCPSDNNVVSSHDTKGDVDPEIEEVAAIKFLLSDSEYLVTSTYRPETIYGVTNIWLNPDSTLVKVRVGNDVLYFGKGAWDSLSHQFEGELLGEVPASKLIGKEVQVPPIEEGCGNSGKKIPILRAPFVKPGEGTGIVMSVPAHAPYDYVALRDLGKLDEVNPVTVLDFEGAPKGKFPAQDVIEKHSVESQQDSKVELATKELYKKEAHGGRMSIGEFSGIPTLDAKEKITSKLVSIGRAFKVHVIAKGPVFCRCGEKVVVKKVDDQWFINYGDSSWKAKAKDCLSRMELIPENTRKDYLATIDWLKEKACTRGSGLGTPFPFDETKIVEPLSDSTIYMAFYTVSHELSKMEPTDLSEEFFDYLFLGKVAPNSESMKEGSPLRQKAQELREKFLYWYPLDARHSGADLVRNHLPFFVFNHSAIFPKENWPKSIVVNGFVLMEGKKMSKSFGNILPLRKAIREYGADVIRFSVVGGAELSADTDFEASVAVGVKERIGYFLSLLDYAKEDGDSPADCWLHSRLNRKLKAAPALYDSMGMRELGQMFFYEMYSELQWYMKRAQKPALKSFLQKWAIAFSPFMPHLAEEIWHSLGGEGFAVEQAFPQADESSIDESAELGEEIVSGVAHDAQMIEERFGKKPSKIYVYVADSQKRGVYSAMREKKDMRAGIEWAKENNADMGKASAFAKSLMKKVHSLGPILSEDEEFSVLSDASSFLSKELAAELIVRRETEGGHDKSGAAAPGKPALVLE
ncbi:leucine--tRNA ligase [Candidatus Micrarchaeota archaeon]|nr:leucine--tRNA ligase [Candidatus Micrarchaeota archaeon]